MEELTEDFEILIVAWLKSGDENVTNLSHSLAKHAEKAFFIQRVSKSLPKRKGRCCGRCDGVHDLCFSDMTCDLHSALGCEDCYGKR